MRCESSAALTGGVALVSVDTLTIFEDLPAHLTKSVIYSGGFIPSDSILFHGTGSHITTDNSAVLIVTGTPWVTNEWAGFTVKNVTDNSSAVIISNTTSQITATLIGGTDADWDIGDVWQIVVTLATPDVIHYEPEAVIVAAQYDFDYTVVDDTDGDIPDTATATVNPVGAPNGFGTVSLDVLGVPTFTPSTAGFSGEIGRVSCRERV